jgi:hypothetical protein
MKSGEDVIGDVNYANDTVRIEGPAVLMPVQGNQAGQMSMGMVPWQPFSKNKEFSIPNDWIVTMSVPTDDIADGWRKSFGSGIEVPSKKMLLS